jgi:hypothetical protein
MLMVNDIERVLQELSSIRRDLGDVRGMTMSDPRNQWIAHARVILNDCLVHLPDMELRRQVRQLLDDEQVQ